MLTEFDEVAAVVGVATPTGATVDVGDALGGAGLLAGVALERTGDGVGTAVAAAVGTAVAIAATLTLVVAVAAVGSIVGPGPPAG